MQIMTRRGPQTLASADFTELRSRYTSTLVDLGAGDGAWPRRFAREQDHCLAIGVDSNRDALREAAKLAERKPARGGAPNTLFVIGQAEALPDELAGVADWVTIYFPWAALLKMILSGDERLPPILSQLMTSRSRLSVVLNAEAVPDGFAEPTPSSLRNSLEQPLDDASLRITRCDWLAADQSPPTTWGGRLVKGSHRPLITLDATR